MPVLPVEETLKEVRDGTVVRTLDRTLSGPGPDAAGIPVPAPEEGPRDGPQGPLPGDRRGVPGRARGHPRRRGRRRAPEHQDHDPGRPQDRGGAPRCIRIGIGYDIHRLEAGRRLVLGGVDIPAAAGPRRPLRRRRPRPRRHRRPARGPRRGRHRRRIFPTPTPASRAPGARPSSRPSSGLLRTRGAGDRQRRRGHRGRGAQDGPARPGHEGRALPHPRVPRDQALGIKAKTNEGLGPVGEKRAVAAYAVALVEMSD
ncbi:MAG: 2-C-methyl-D-erythritol 2,4-cyclodiphosphate synthase [Desulfomicrobium escambiense]|nr:2-C-methyl-D-erythritol 2,4-cyclodiphosphate synthase [Desulfomicrobium escambiense]